VLGSEETNESGTNTGDDQVVGIVTVGGKLTETETETSSGTETTGEGSVGAIETETGTYGAATET
jgi:hypothetical protein